MKRIAFTIVQARPGADEWVQLGGPTTEVSALVDQLKALPLGDQVAMIVATGVSAGVMKRAKVKYVQPVKGSKK